MEEDLRALWRECHVDLVSLSTFESILNTIESRVECTANNSCRWSIRLPRTSEPRAGHGATMPGFLGRETGDHFIMADADDGNTSPQLTENEEVASSSIIQNLHVWTRRSSSLRQSPKSRMPSTASLQAIRCQMRWRIASKGGLLPPTSTAADRGQSHSQSR